MRYISFIIIIITLFAFSSIRAQAFKEVTIPFEDVNAQKKLKMRIFTGNIKITGTDRKDIYVKYKNLATEDYDKQQQKENSKGLKKIGGSNFELEMGSEQNFAYIKSQAWNAHLIFEILVPKNIDLDINKQIGDDVNIDNIEGIVNIENTVGNITATNISGIVNASTNAGNLVLSFNEITENKAMMFNNTAGEIDISFPADFKANLKLKTQMGEIYSDLDIVIKPSDQNGETKQDENGFKYIKDNWTHATLNGGGPEITLKSKVGNIYLRKTLK